VVVVRRATGRNQGDVSADYGISGVISGSAAPAALRHPSVFKQRIVRITVPKYTADESP
jgi:hypothetical protein